MEPFLEPPTAEPPTERPMDPKKLKQMEKKLDELSRKIRHSEKKNNELIHELDLPRRVIKEIKQANRRQPTIE